jgi:hypothetical protein
MFDRFNLSRSKLAVVEFATFSLELVKLSFVVVWLVSPMLAFAGDQTDDKERIATQQSRWLGIKFALLQPAEFLMGSKRSEKGRRDDGPGMKSSFQPS